MATNEQIDRIVRKMETMRPAEPFKKLDESRAGISATLKLLDDLGGEATAGQISTNLHISTARVAVLIKKMVQKELVTKERGKDDARMTVVKLTEHGKDVFLQIENHLHRQIENIIDAVGEEKLLEFLAISKQICDVIQKPNIDF